MSNGNILVVDDATESLKLLVGILTAEGYEVHPADSGELALASTKYITPELILLDIRMPGNDGFEVMRQLKSSKELRDIPVMFISASNVVNDHLLSFDLGAVDFVSKPFRNEEVLARVQTHLELSRLRTQLKKEVDERTKELSLAISLLEKEFVERERIESDRQIFYRETIYSATNGKLQICDYVDMVRYIIEAQVRIAADGFANLYKTRSEAREFCIEHGIVNDKLDDFIYGFGEAIDNAVKHCGKGSVLMGADSESVWIVVSDKGPGIESLVLPKAVLRRGFSTKASMGLGYSIILETADQVLLSTSDEGTNIVLIKNIISDKAISLDSFPETWDMIPDSF